jgi:hypothetical protein
LINKFLFHEKIKRMKSAIKTLDILMLSLSIILSLRIILTFVLIVSTTSLAVYSQIELRYCENRIHGYVKKKWGNSWRQYPEKLLEFHVFCLLQYRKGYLKCLFVPE